MYPFAWRLAREEGHGPQGWGTGQQTSQELLDRAGIPFEVTRSHLWSYAADHDQQHLESLHRPQRVRYVGRHENHLALAHLVGGTADRDLDGAFQHVNERVERCRVGVDQEQPSSRIPSCGYCSSFLSSSGLTSPWTMPTILSDLSRT
jgi:hypothetical protein